MWGTAGGLQAPVPSGPPTKIAGMPEITGFWATADGTTTKNVRANAAMAKRIFTFSPLSSKTALFQLTRLSPYPSTRLRRPG